MTRIARLLTALALGLSTAGCASPAYYLQAFSGQMDILAKRRPVNEVLNDPTTAPQTRQQLGAVLRLREFASRELGLPDNESYRRYADLDRPYAVWNVFAAPELSLKPIEWCFPFAGCVSYRGYFAQADAEAFAAGLHAQGNDVYVGGAIAYSTLGWFDDPVLNTMLRRPEPELAGLIFHELAHQRLYLKGDTAFNESFAVTVELEGVRRWYERHDAPQVYADYLERKKRRDEFTALVLKYRARIEAVYAAPRPDDEKRALKRETFAELRREHTALKARWGGYDGYDGWFDAGLNNARIAAVGVYHQYVAAFQALLAKHRGDLAAFYREAQELARLPPDERATMLEKLSTQARAR